jgi:hypothetical protein
MYYDNLSKDKQLLEKKGFSIQDIIDFLRSECRKEDSSPYYQLICSRSIAVIEDIVDRLVESGLLIEHDDIFKKSEEYSKLFYVVNKKIRRSAKRRIAWAVRYLYHKGLVSLSMSELLDELSYSNEEYKTEIPRLQIPKENSWVKLLEESGDVWKLIEEPHLSTKNLLLLDIQRRLLVAVSELSKSGNRFRTEDIIAKMRQLEIASIERFLRRMGLKYKERRWNISNVALDKTRSVFAEIEAENWPFFGVLIVRSPYFKPLGTQSRTLYVDISNSFIINVVEALQLANQKYRDDKEKMYKNAIKLTKTANHRFKEKWGDWLSFKIRRAPFMSQTFGLQIRINWKAFFDFLEIFSQKDMSLMGKYQYIFDCRAPSLKLAMRADLERTQHDVKEVCNEEIEQIKNNIDDLVNNLRRTKDRLYRISKRKTIRLEPSTLQYLPEMVSTLQALVYLVENGTIPACYREMRKILENLSWMIFDDLLLFRSSVFKSRRLQEMEVPNPYGLISKEWYDWSRAHAYIARNLSEMKESIQSIVERIHFHGKNEGYSWKKKQIEEALFKRLSSSVFLLLMGKKAKLTKKSRRFVPRYETKSLRPIAFEDLKSVIRELDDSSLGPSTEKFLETLVQDLVTQLPSEEIVPPYPSNEFVLGFIVKTFSNSLLKREYDEYSRFVHSYFTSWHIFPFSSLLEFKTFKCEFFAFAENVQQLINAYVKELFT